MTHDEAIAIVLDLASRWGENAEEGFTRRVQPADTDEACADNAAASGALPEEVIEVRNLWRDIESINAKAPLPNAIWHVSEVASLWAGNEADGMDPGISAGIDDEACARVADQNEREADEIITIRDAFRAVQLLRSADIEDVFAYFVARLGADPTDETLKTLPLDSVCGEACRGAIDAAAAFKAIADKAAPWIAEGIISACDETCGVFWRG